MLGYFASREWAAFETRCDDVRGSFLVCTFVGRLACNVHIVVFRAHGTTMLLGEPLAAKQERWCVWETSLVSRKTCHVVVLLAKRRNDCMLPWPARCRRWPRGQPQDPVALAEAGEPQGGFAEQAEEQGGPNLADRVRVWTASVLESTAIWLALHVGVLRTMRVQFNLARLVGLWDNVCDGLQKFDDCSTDPSQMKLTHARQHQQARAQLHVAQVGNVLCV